jgi:hypothetical protein
MKVRHCKALSKRIIGIITDYNQFMSHGDGLAVVDNDSEYSIKYEVGDVLVPSESGLCRKAEEQDLMFAMMYQIKLPRIMALLPDREFVAIFMS